jgi:hypothetical protein
VPQDVVLNKHLCHGCNLVKPLPGFLKLSPLLKTDATPHPRLKKDPRARVIALDGGEPCIDEHLSVGFGNMFL